MGQPALIAEGPPHRRRADALHAWSFVGQRGFDVEVIYIHVQIPLLAEVVGVLNGGAQYFLNQRRDTLLGEGHCLQCFSHAPSLDQLQYQASFLRRYPLELRFGPEFLCFQLHWLLPLTCFSGAWPTTRLLWPSDP